MIDVEAIPTWLNDGFGIDDYCGQLCQFGEWAHLSSERINEVDNYNLYHSMIHPRKYLLSCKYDDPNGCTGGENFNDR